MPLTIPALSLVVLIGPSGSGKSTFAHRHFKPTEVLSSDTCRALVADDETDQAATPDAFAILHFIAAKRLATGRLTVVDATNVRAEDRKPLLALAREYHCLPVAIVFDLPEELCQAHNRARSDRDFGPHVVRNQLRELKRGLRGLKREGFRHLYTFTSPEEVDAAELVRVPLWTDRRPEHGPFDIIGDVHGCFDELVELLTALGYTLHRQPGATLAETTYTVSHPEDRRAVFLGDLVDRGPKTPEVLRLVVDMVAAGTALCVPGNHDIKLQRKLQGRDVRITHGLAESLAQLEQAPPAFQQQVIDFIDNLVSHSVLDEGRLVVAHAGMPATMQGRASGRVREFALYGETTGETDEYGLPVRYHWAADYRGKALVVYGHTPVLEPEWLNRTLCLDTGCVFGGRLTALRYPERELVSVPARCVYYLALTERGGEGMVVKPWDFLSQGRRGGVQPALKCRGREYLRIIYGPEYTAPEHLARLRERGLSAKRTLARREFALGLEALERFTRGEPLRRVHECVAGVLALESEPVDPRL